MVDGINIGGQVQPNIQGLAQLINRQSTTPSEVARVQSLSEAPVSSLLGGINKIMAQRKLGQIEQQQAQVESQQKQQMAQQLAQMMNKPDQEAALGSLSKEQLATMMANTMKPKDPVKVGRFDRLVTPTGEELVGAQPDYNQMIVTGPDGKPQVNELFVTGKERVARAGKPITSVNVNAGGEQASAFDKEFGKIAAKTISEGRGSARLAAENLRSLDVLQSIAQTGAMQTGFAQEQIDELKKAGRRMGVNVDKKGINANEIFKNISRKLALNTLKDFKGATSEKEMLESIKVNPSLILEPENIRIFTGILAQENKQKIDNFVTDVNAMKGIGGAPENVDKFITPDLLDVPQFDAINFEEEFGQGAADTPTLDQLPDDELEFLRSQGLL